MHAGTKEGHASREFVGNSCIISISVERGIIIRLLIGNARAWQCASWYRGGHASVLSNGPHVEGIMQEQKTKSDKQPGCTHGIRACFVGDGAFTVCFF